MKKFTILLLLFVGCFTTAVSQVGPKRFIDFGGVFSKGEYGEGKFEISTAYGYQFNPYIYTGIGIGINYYLDSQVRAYPIFIHARGYLLDYFISPYLDLRGGYSISKIEGLYLSPSIGCKIGPFNIGVGYVMQNRSKDIIKYGTSSGNEMWITEHSTVKCEGFSLKLGFEF